MLFYFVVRLQSSTEEVISSAKTLKERHGINRFYTIDKRIMACSKKSDIGSKYEKMDFDLEIDTTFFGNNLSVCDILSVKPIFLEDWWLERSTSLGKLKTIHSTFGNVTCKVYYELRKACHLPDSQTSTIGKDLWAYFFVLRTRYFRRVQNST